MIIAFIGYEHKDAYAGVQKASYGEYGVIEPFSFLHLLLQISIFCACAKLMHLVVNCLRLLTKCLTLVASAICLVQL